MPEPISMDFMEIYVNAQNSPAEQGPNKIMWCGAWNLHLFRGLKAGGAGKPPRMINTCRYLKHSRYIYH